MIEVKNAFKKFGRIKALDGVSFNVQEGKITALLGINGVGKSTTLKSIMGLVKLDDGDIFIDGEKLKHKTYNKIAMVPDVDTQYPNMTIKDAFEYMEVFYENWDMDKAYKMLKVFKLSDDRKMAKLSKGNLARVKIILGFSQNAKYLLLDEPFSGIDVFTREDFIESMINYMDEDMAILITTHEIKEVENIVDEVILLEDGKVVLDFNAEEVRENEGLSVLDKMREVYRSAKE